MPALLAYLRLSRIKPSVAHGANGVWLKLLLVPKSIQLEDGGCIQYTVEEMHETGPPVAHRPPVQLSKLSISYP